MPAMPDSLPIKSALQSTCQRACQTIAPAWPLDQAVAVNPHWQRVDKPIEKVAARLGLLGGFNVFPDFDYIHNCWTGGRISPKDLDIARAQYAYKQTDQAPSAQECIDALSDKPQRIMPLIVDLLEDDEHDTRRLAWRGAITFQLGQSCGAYFDKDQGHWLPTADEGLYAFWYDSLKNDHGIGVVMGLPKFHKVLKQLPRNADDALAWAFDQLVLSRVPQQVYLQAIEPYLEALLLSVNGWASWCAWLKYQAEGHGKTDRHLYELLAMRVAWEALLIRCHPKRARETRKELFSVWHELPQRIKNAERRYLIDAIWQSALEIGFQRDLATKLSRSNTAEPTEHERDVQMVFCIDIRSEPMRRAIEAEHAGVETRAYAGSFGMPMSYQPFGSRQPRPQMPGLGFPEVCVEDTFIAPKGMLLNKDQLAAIHKNQLAARDQWQNTIRWANTTFSYVEAVGFGYLKNIWRWIYPPARARHSLDHTGLNGDQQACLRPRLTGATLAQKTQLAKTILSTMGLDKNLAKLVIFTGHCSQSKNNAHASTLDCGACGGQSGEANVRALAALVNEPQVRQQLKHEGFEIPDDTVFMAALHNTATDLVSPFDLDLLPNWHFDRWEQLVGPIFRAGDRVRRERAPTLWMDAKEDADALLEDFQRRANDGSETRPEWGLTTNAGFIIGPRYISQHAKFNRCYLHDYDPKTDTDFSILEALMLGPMLVTHWLGWQYHASTADPLHYGAGNKVLHNIVGGRIGVFEGNGGDLRIGIPKQSLFDGKQWRHEPLRQTTVIAAPCEAISQIIQKHAILKQVIENGWMNLWQYHDQSLMRYSAGSWHSLAL